MMMRFIAVSARGQSSKGRRGIAVFEEVERRESGDNHGPESEAQMWPKGVNKGVRSPSFLGRERAASVLCVYVL